MTDPKERNLHRQRISSSQPNNEWLPQQISAGAEYCSKSELINEPIKELIGNARRAETLNQKLAAAEQSGFTSQSPAKILEEFKRDLATSV
jgi:antitoxin ParD1/3/4